MTSMMAPEERNGTEEQTVIGRSTTVRDDVGGQTCAKDSVTLNQYDSSPHRDPSRSIPMPLARSVPTAPSLERSSPPGTDASGIGRLATSALNKVPRAVCFPRDDGEFTARVQTLLDGSHSALLDGSHSEGPFAATVQAFLRETYPLAVISPRLEFAALDSRRVWYAFRDGSAMPNVEGDTS